MGNRFSINGAEIIGYSFGVEGIATLHLTKKEEKEVGLDFRLIKNLNIKGKMIELFVNNIGDYLYYFEIENDILRYIKHNT